MRPAGEQEVRSDLPVIDRSFFWMTSTLHVNWPVEALGWLII
jgi:hypothetical protein